MTPDEFPRKAYLDMLIKRKWNGMIKVITGIRRCGKSYLLFKLFRNHLLSEGVDGSHIICIELDDVRNKHLRNDTALYEYITQHITDSSRYYVLLDEIQFVKDFTDVLNGMLHIENVDCYVTGSNSKFPVKRYHNRVQGQRGRDPCAPALLFGIHRSRRGWQGPS